MSKREGMTVYRHNGFIVTGGQPGSGCFSFYGRFFLHEEIVFYTGAAHAHYVPVLFAGRGMGAKGTGKGFFFPFNSNASTDAPTSDLFLTWVTNVYLLSFSLPAAAQWPE